MKKVIKIITFAFRNIFRDKKRSLLIAICIFISTLVLLITAALQEGVKSQLIQDVITIQTGHISFVWESDYIPVKNEPLQIIDPKMNIKYADREQNIKQYQELLKLLAKDSRIKNFYRRITQHVTATLNHQKYRLIVRGVEDSEIKSILKSNFPLGGRFIKPGQNEVYICETIAKKFKLQIGDPLIVVADTPYGAKNALNLSISGIYKEGAPWNKSYAFVTLDDALSLFDLSEMGQYVAAEVYNENEITKIVNDYNLLFKKQGLPFKAQSYMDGAAFFMGVPASGQIILGIIGFVVGFIVLIGIYSIITANIFERKKEIGTLRAIGFSRSSIIFLFVTEMIVQSLLVYIASLIVALLFVFIFGNIGINTGSEAMKYQFAGKSIYPRIEIGSIISTFIFVTVAVCIVSILPIINFSKKRVVELLYGSNH